MKLNKQQNQAVHTTNGRLLILAGAGSGKTRVIITRIVHLIKTLNVNPNAILGLTFTNKAAKEMRQRVAKSLSKEQAKEVTLTTFHSFCMKVLRSHIEKLGYTRNFSLYDEKDMRRLLTQIARDEWVGEEEIPSLESTFQEIAEVKSRGGTESDLDHDAFSQKIYAQMGQSLRAYNAVDFDSLISLTIKLFETEESVLEIFQKQYQYIMIDEYQDTNPLQYRLAELLSKKHNNLCVVGDDDQSIYSWRGAEIKHILEFKADTTIKLEDNYRSTSPILNGANSVIQNNKARHPKTLRSNKPEGNKIEVFHAPSDQDEAQGVVDRILELKLQYQLRWKDIAILYRSNILSRPFELLLMQTPWKKKDGWARGIPYQVFGGTEFFARSEVKDLMSYLRIVENPYDQEAILRVINYPRRGISDNTLDIITQINRREKRPLYHVLKDIGDQHPKYDGKITTRGINGVKKFLHILGKAQLQFETNSLHTSLEWLIDEIDYKQVVSDEVKTETTKAFKLENIQECINALKQYETDIKNPSLQDFLSNAALDQTQLRQEKVFDDKVTLLTFHSAKGLEFPACFLVGLEDHIIPHEKSQTREGIEEERRLMYVAMTRAKNHLFLSMAQKRGRRGSNENSNPSRFLYEIPENVMSVTSWKKF
ncbi:MAG: UvrD-helicase domain-containing protein [Simkaniaceae bacterium]|nr:UvrD-helicase domain-containing protein [Simkaniaceae bacterium]